MSPQPLCPALPTPYLLPNFRNGWRPRGLTLPCFRPHLARAAGAIEVTRTPHELTLPLPAREQVTVVILPTH